MTLWKNAIPPVGKHVDIRWRTRSFLRARGTFVDLRLGRRSLAPFGEAGSPSADLESRAGPPALVPARVTSGDAQRVRPCGKRLGHVPGDRGRRLGGHAPQRNLEARDSERAGENLDDNAASLAVFDDLIHELHRLPAPAR